MKTAAVEQNRINMRTRIGVFAGPDNAAALFVYSVWLAMFLWTLASIFSYGKSIPLSEDWSLVPALTGNEKDLAGWLWAQNNEHRIPLPKAILLVLLKASRGDFRAGMFLSTCMLGIVSLLMILTARGMRRGRTHFQDAFFPILLLHLGNWPNLVWGWQFTFVLPVSLACAALLVIASGNFRTLTGAAATSFCAVALPLCGAVGLLYMPFIFLWLLLLRRFHGRPGDEKNKVGTITVILIGSATVALCISVFYFVGYQRPTWNPPSPGPLAAAKTAAQFLALGLGPAAAKSWRASVLLTNGLLATTILFTIIYFRRAEGIEKYRTVGMLLFLGNMVVFSGAMGFGRAGLVPKVGLPDWYVLLAAPALVAVFYSWEICGSRAASSVVQSALFLTTVLLLPLNTTVGYNWGNWYREGMTRFEKDVARGAPPSLLADAHQSFLLHWDRKKLLSGMEMLQKADIGIFAKMRSEVPEPTCKRKR